MEQVFTYFTTVVIIYQTVFHSLENTREKVVKGIRSISFTNIPVSVEKISKLFLSIHFSAINLAPLILSVEKLKIIGFWDLYVSWQKQRISILVRRRV